MDTTYIRIANVDGCPYLFSFQSDAGSPDSFEVTVAALNYVNSALESAFELHYYEDGDVTLGTVQFDESNGEVKMTKDFASMANSKVSHQRNIWKEVEATLRNICS